TTAVDGNLWFTELGSNDIGRINPTTGTITEYVVPLNSSGGIAAGPDGKVWFGVGGYGIGRIDPFTGAITEFALPPAAVPWGTPTGLVAGPDGNVWFGTVYGSDVVGRITPSGVITQYVVSSGQGTVFSLATGPDGNVWFTDMPNSIGRINLVHACASAHLSAST